MERFLSLLPSIWSRSHIVCGCVVRSDPSDLNHHMSAMRVELQQPDVPECALHSLVLNACVDGRPWPVVVYKIKAGQRTERDEVQNIETQWVINKTERWWYVGQRRSTGAVVDLIQLLTLRSSCAEVVLAIHCSELSSWFCGDGGGFVLLWPVGRRRQLHRVPRNNCAIIIFRIYYYCVCRLCKSIKVSCWWCATRDQMDI